MQKITTYRPDTCGCVINFYIDTDEPPDEDGNKIVHHFWRTDAVDPVNGKPRPEWNSKLCDEHKNFGLPENTASHQHIHLVENRRKNLVYAILYRDFGVDVIEKDANGERGYTWSFDINRKLIARIKGSRIGLNQGQLNQLRAKYAEEIGDSTVLDFEVV